MSSGLPTYLLHDRKRNRVQPTVHKGHNKNGAAPTQGWFKSLQIRVSLFLPDFWAFSETTPPSQITSPLSPLCLHYKIRDDGCKSHKMLAAGMSSSGQPSQLFGICDVLPCVDFRSGDSCHHPLFSAPQQALAAQGKRIRGKAGVCDP